MPTIVGPVDWSKYSINGCTIEVFGLYPCEQEYDGIYFKDYLDQRLKSYDRDGTRCEIYSDVPLFDKSDYTKNHHLMYNDFHDCFYTKNCPYKNTVFYPTDINYYIDKKGETVEMGSSSIFELLHKKLSKKKQLEVITEIKSWANNFYELIDILFDFESTKVIQRLEEFKLRFHDNEAGEILRKSIDNIIQSPLIIRKKMHIIASEMSKLKDHQRFLMTIKYFIRSRIFTYLDRIYVPLDNLESYMYDIGGLVITIDAFLTSAYLLTVMLRHVLFDDNPPNVVILPLYSIHDRDVRIFFDTFLKADKKGEIELEYTDEGDTICKIDL